MRRLLIAAFASLLAVALITPGAQGATGVKTLTLEGEFAGGAVHPMQVQMKIDYLVKHKSGHKRLIPNRVTQFEFAFPRPLSCDQGSLFDVGGGSGFVNIPITKKQFSSTYTTIGPVVRPEDVAGQDEMEESGQEAEAARPDVLLEEGLGSAQHHRLRLARQGVHELHQQRPGVLVGAPVPQPEQRPRLPPRV